MVSVHAENWQSLKSLAVKEQKHIFLIITNRSTTSPLIKSLSTVSLLILEIIFIVTTTYATITSNKMNFSPISSSISSNNYKKSNNLDFWRQSNHRRDQKLR